MAVILREAFEQSWTQANAFDHVRKIEGDVVRNKEGRRTLRFEFNGNAYYLKHHSGVGWREILKNLAHLKWPVISASNEWIAINKLTKLGVDTLTAVAYGEQGSNPAKTESFLITQELVGTLSLAKYCEDWINTPPSFKEKINIIKTVAAIAKKIHKNGINHRDLYICHFLLKLDSLKTEVPMLYLVDLHRAQCRHTVPKRWMIKDVGSIYFSAMDIGLTKRDVFRFLSIYFDETPRKILSTRLPLLYTIKARAEKLYWRDFKRKAPELL